MKNPALKSDKAAEKTKPASPGVGGGKQVAAPSVVTIIDQDDQSDVFDKAIAIFQKGDLGQAKKLFEKAAAGPLREVAHAARIHLQICERRMRQAAPAPASAEDHYNVAIALMNRRELDAAEKHLQDALRQAPDGDHIYYAMALVSGLKGRLRQAFDSMKRAIELNPANRTHARSDPDFAGFAHQQPLAALLFPDRERHT